MVLLVLSSMWLVWRLVVKKKIRPTVASKPISQRDIKERIVAAENAGVDVSAAQTELKKLAARQQSGAIHLCFFGEVSSGKSSLIKALVPDANVMIDVVAGSTDDIRHYRWRNDNGDEIRLTDVPGTGGHEDGLDTIATEEALRSHLVLFVCDGDLTRAELSAVKALLAFDKPIIVVLNKADRFDADEKAALMQRLLQRIDALGAEIQRDHVVAVTAGGETDIVEHYSDGREVSVRRRRDADIGVLVVAINRLLGDNTQPLDLRRDRAVFQIAAARLEEAEAEYRLQRAEQIIRNATRKAIVGALAAVSPGADILIQGYLATTMTQELCRIFGAAPRDLDIEEFLSLSQSRAGRALPLSLSVAGNGLKAFPGIGTVAGGLVHAVAYGLIFDALGRSLVLTLTENGSFIPETAARDFEESISEHLETGVRRIAKMALDEK
jgi:GTP-binding protein EngB required for normal cell division/uncharacterized protein (DUF697 family)